MDKIYKFEAEVDGDVYSGESFPIYDDDGKKLLGGFVLKEGATVFGFISGVGHSTALFVSTGASFYFTPREDKNGKVSYGIISELPISPLSVGIDKVYEEVRGE